MMLWLCWTALAHGQALGAWDVSLHTALWTVPPELRFAWTDRFGDHVPQSRSFGGQLGWRSKAAGSSAEVFLRSTAWRYSDTSILPEDGLAWRTRTTLLMGAGWRHVQPVRRHWSLDFAASLAVGSAPNLFRLDPGNRLLISPCAEAGIWGENVRVGLRGCGSLPNTTGGFHDIVVTRPEPSGIRLVVGARLHTWVDHPGPQRADDATLGDTEYCKNE